MLVRRPCPLHSVWQHPPTLLPRCVRFHSTFEDDALSSIGHSANPLSERPRNIDVPTRGQLSLRTALDNLAQDLLDLSHYLAKASHTRQQLLNQRTNITQLYIRIQDEERKAQYAENIQSIIQTVQDAEKDILDARQRQILNTSFFVRLKRIHGRLPYPEIPYYESETQYAEELRHSDHVLHTVLALPVPTLLNDLAQHLLTSSLPFSENSFIIMMRKLADFRYGSVARSAYLHFISAGFSPTSSKAIALLIKLTVSIGDYREFTRLRRLLRESDIPHDIYLHGAIIVGCLKLGIPDAARRHFQRMIAQGFRPPLQVLTRYLHDCGSRRQWELGTEIWRVIKSGKAHADFTIDAWAYHEMWRLCRKCEQLHIAREILREAEEDGLNSRDIIQHPRVKTQGPPIRASNKFPSLQDYKTAFEKGYHILPTRPTPRERMKRLSLPQLRALEPANSESSFVIAASGTPTSAVSEARAKVDLMVFDRLRTLTTTEIDIVEALKEKPAEPVDDVLWNMHVSTKEMMDDEYMADIIQESGDAFLAGMNLDRPPPPLPPTNEERLQSLFSRKGASARNNPHPEQPSPQLSHSRPRRPNQLSMRQTRRVFIPKSRLPRKLEETVDV